LHTQPTSQACMHPFATTTTSVVTVAPVARAAAGDSFVEASIPAASEEVVETRCGLHEMASIMGIRKRLRANVRSQRER